MKNQKNIEVPTSSWQLFQNDHFLGFRPDSEIYDMSNIEIKQQVNDLEHYQSEKQIDTLVKLLNIKLKIQKISDDHAYEINATLCALAEKYLEQGDLELAKQSAQSAIDNLKSTFSTQLIRPLTLLNKILIQERRYDESTVSINDNFDKAQEILEFNFGDIHPLHVNIYNTMSKFYRNNEEMHEAILLLQSSKNCVVRCLGKNHQYTALQYLELAQEYETMGKKTEAAYCYQIAFNIMETNFEKKSPQCAEIAYSLAQMYYDIGNQQQSLHYLKLAQEYYCD